MLHSIVEAIENLRVLQVYYDPGVRLIEPHAVGRTADGDIVVRAFQTAGASASGEHSNWKLFRLDCAGSIEPTKTPFDGPRPGYKRGDKAMKGGIIAQL